MIALLFILGNGLTLAICSSTIRIIQASSRNWYMSMVANYATALALAVAYAAGRGAPADWLGPIAVGLYTGFFYLVSLLAVFRSMSQRGLGMTAAITNMAVLVPVVLAIAFGEHPSGLQIVGILLTMAALPLLSVASVIGNAIAERPNARLAALLFLLQGGAASGNLLASKLLPQADLPAYLVALFAWGLVISLAAWSRLDRSCSLGDVGRGALYGITNVGCTLFILIALAYVDGCIFFAGMGVLALLFSVMAGALFWRERVQSWGWVGCSLAAAAVVLLNMK